MRVVESESGFQRSNKRIFNHDKESPGTQNGVMAAYQHRAGSDHVFLP